MISALLDLQFCKPDRAKQFRCAGCPESVQKLRRCKEPRRDFTEADGALWPIQISPGGELYSFCPGLATRDPEATFLYRSLVLCAETGQLWTIGGIAEQPDWFIDLAAEFVPRYTEHRFYSRANAILGDSKSSSGAALPGGFKNGGNKRVG